ncbi:MAG: tetratricopeptide repeat protein [Chitinophagales bacterium]|nr:tetratricopeptide repeat protein [Chitinophagales bacterium]
MNYFFVSTALFISLSCIGQDKEDIVQLIENERYASAEKVLESAIREKGPEPSLNYLMVKTYLEQDKEEDAREFVEGNKLDDVAADPLSRISYARYQLREGNKESALSVFNEILDGRKNKKNVQLLLAIAEVMISEEKGDNNSAIELLKAAGKYDKKNPGTDLLLGMAYRKLKDASSAYLSYREALKKDPANVKAYYLLGKIFSDQKNPEVYLEQYLKAYAIDSTYAPVLEALYEHYYFRDVKLARKYLEKFIAASDYSLQNDYRLTDLLYLTGDHQEAINSSLSILDKAKDSVQPRLFKLIAYSYAAIGDSVKATVYLNDYFNKAGKENLIAKDFVFRAALSDRVPGNEKETISYYIKAVELDSVAANRTTYAVQLAGLYKKAAAYKEQSYWLGKVYSWKENPSNIDLFNWGLATYNAQNYPAADSIFTLYTTTYPDNIYGYYWRATVNAAVDTAMQLGLAIPHYKKLIEVGETDIKSNKAMLLKAYSYLAVFEANNTKNYPAALNWFEKYKALEPGNADINKYIETLEKWIAEGK